ncbi:MAG: hypothetical protein WCG84_02560 [Candidatus Moraniibacteriota bacterium]
MSENEVFFDRNSFIKGLIKEFLKEGQQKTEREILDHIAIETAIVSHDKIPEPIRDLTLNYLREAIQLKSRWLTFSISIRNSQNEYSLR